MTEKASEEKKEETQKEQVPESTEKEQVQEDVYAGDDEEESKSSLTFLLSTVVVLVLLGGIVYFALPSEPTYTTPEELYRAIAEGRVDDPEVGYLYNGFVFVRTVEDTWRTDLQVEGEHIPVTFRFGPREVEHVPVEGNVDERFNRQPMYLTINPYSEQQSHIGLAAADIGSHLHRGMNISALAACTEEHPDCEERPIVTCDSTNAPVIHVRVAEEARIILDGNCVIVEGDGLDMVRAADKFLFMWYRIIT